MRPTLRGRQIVLRHLIAVVPALAGLLVVAGCYRRVSYVSPEGRKVEIVNIGFDTRIGSLHAIYYATVGNQTAVAEAKRMGAEIARELHQADVGAVLLVAT